MYYIWVNGACREYEWCNKGDGGEEPVDCAVLLWWCDQMIFESKGDVSFNFWCL